MSRPIQTGAHFMFRKFNIVVFSVCSCTNLIGCSGGEKEGSGTPTDIKGWDTKSHKKESETQGDKKLLETLKLPKADYGLDADLKVTSIHLSYVQNAHASDISFLKGLDRLKFLDLTGTKIDGDQLAVLENHSQLKELKLGQCG